MFKQHKFKIIISSVITALPMLFGIIVWNKLPEKIATHWGANGQPDQYSSKLTAVILLPLILLAVHLLCLFATSFDKKNKEQNKKVFGLIFWLCPAVSLIANGMTYVNALGTELNVINIAVLFMGVLFIVLGNYMPKCKHNFTIGFRIPTTLGSEENWNATHRFAGKCFVIAGIILLPCIFLPQNLSVLTLFAIFPVALIPIIYSYWFESKRNK